jgi:hypothetical protein
MVYLGSGVLFTWPLFLHPTTRLAAQVGPGDPFLNLWILGWGMQTILADPAALVTGRVFNANIFYPADATLAYSDHLLLQSAVMAPLYAITGDVVLCYNVLLFVSLVASGLAMHAFVRAVTGSTGGAYLAGLAWAFWPYRFAHLVHLQLQALYFLPLAFLFVHRVIVARRQRDAAALGVIAGLQAISSVYYGVIGAFGLATGAVALAAGVGRWRSGVIARRLLLAAVVGAILVAPMVIIYWRVQRSEGFGRNVYDARHNAARVASYSQVPPQNVIYGRTGVLVPPAERRPDEDVPRGGPERALFPGAIVVALAAAGIAFGWRGDARPLVLAMTAVGAIGFTLSLGPDGFGPLYTTLHRFVFGFQAVRAPARFGVLVMFALATLAAVGWRELGRGAHHPHRFRLSPPVLAGAIVLAAVEFLNVPIPLVAAPRQQTEIGQWLRREPARGAVVYLPLGVDIESTPAMVQSLEHRRPLVNGYSGHRPAFYPALADTLSTFPNDEALIALRELGVLFAVTPTPIVPRTPDAAWPLVERARFGDGVIYELRWTPDMEARLSAASSVMPAPPGPPTFGTGEIARYAVKWDGAAMNLVAGEVTIAVQAPEYTFRVEAQTAPWVARFFEAQEKFLTRANARLLPQVHEREQREGSRHIRRVFLYDHTRGVVRMGRDAEQAASREGVSLPLPLESRDAISALFYARTLPLDPGVRHVIPINESGQNLRVELSVEGRETVEVAGRPVEAIRIQPRLQRRLERRQPLSATLWVSADASRVPVLVQLEAGFGRVRVELIHYQR